MKNTHKKLQVAVIGTGQISEQHLKFIENYKSAELVAVCDLSFALADYAAKRFNAKHAMQDYKKMLFELKPELVHVLTPPNTHFEIVTECLKSGTNVIVEKPIAPNNKEFKILWEEANSKNLIITEDHNLLFENSVIKLNELVQKGKFGKVKDVDIRLNLRIRDVGSRYADLNLPHPSHKMPGGVIHEYITHLCYLVLSFIPKDKNLNIKNNDKICAMWNNHGGGNLFKYDDLEAIIVIDGIHIHIRFSVSSRPECFNIQIRGTKGSAETDLFLPYTKIDLPIKCRQLSPLINQWKLGWHMVKMSIKNLFDKLQKNSSYIGLARYLDKTYFAILHGTRLPVTFEDMNRVSKLIDALISEANKN